MRKSKVRWRPSPLLVVLATTLVVVVGMLGLGWLNARRYRVNARVEIAEPVIEPIAAKGTATATVGVLPDGEVARLAVRVREAAGLVMGLAMLALTEQINRQQVASVDALLDLLTQRALLPPGVQRQTAQGVLASERAVLYVRYRPRPLGVEVISIGRERLDGPAIIARLVTGGDDQTGAVLLVARKVESVTPPEPFAPLDQVAGMNWRMEPLREGAFSPQEVEQLNHWARQYAESTK